MKRGFVGAEYETTLPVGYDDGSGKIRRRAVLRKMRGHEEALLADLSLRGGNLVTELIRSCLVRLEDLEEVDSRLVGELYAADRNFLMVELRRITLGDRLPVSYRCPSCEGEVALEEDLGALEVRWLEEGETPEEFTLELEDGYTDRRGTLHRSVRLALPRGVDEEFVSPLFQKDPLRAQEALLLRCIRSFGTLPRTELEAYGVKMLRDLTMGDRKLLFHSFLDRMPGVDFRRKIRCPSCGTGFEGVLDLSSFFFLN